MMKKKLSVFLFASVLFAFLTACSETGKAVELMPLVQKQLNMGPRTPGSEAHARFVEYASELLKAAGWTVHSASEKYEGKTVQNVIADRGPKDPSEWIVIGAHYDSRITADQELQPEDRQKSVPAANDGA